MFAVLRKPSVGFAKDLLASLAAATCALRSGSGPGTVAFLRLIVDGFRYFPGETEEEVRLRFGAAEHLVAAHVVALHRLVQANQPTADAQRCAADLLQIILSPSVDGGSRPAGFAGQMLALSRQILSVQKELLLPFDPKFSAAFNLISSILVQSEFEHEQIESLKLLILLTEWISADAPIIEELLCIFPVIRLTMSPSRLVKSLASRFLSRFSALPDANAVVVQEQSTTQENSDVSTHASILPKLLHRITGDRKLAYSSYFQLKLNRNSSSSPVSWVVRLIDYLSSLDRQKLHQFYAAKLVFWLLGSVICVLLSYAELGDLAAEALAILGSKEPALAMPLLLVILFHIKIFSLEKHRSEEIVLRLLKALPSLASFQFMLPFTLQTIYPMLDKEAKPVLYAVAIRLLCKTWIVADQAFPMLQSVCNPETFSNFASDKEISLSIAASVHDVCRHDPDRGVDLILAVSALIDSRDSSVRAIGLESLASLCEADVVDFYTAWKVISRQLLESSPDPIVSYGMCQLLKWGFLDADSYPEESKDIVRILWDVAMSKEWSKSRSAAFGSLSKYKIEVVEAAIPNFKQRNYECFINEDDPEVLEAMENFESEIIRHEHLNRRRQVMISDKRPSTARRAERLLDAFPRIVFSSGKLFPRDLPGAALLSLSFTPKNLLHNGTPKDLLALHAAYEEAMVEIADSLPLSWNIAMVLLALQSWKVFMENWISAVMAVIADKHSSDDAALRAASEVIKILCKVVAESIPRVAVNVALAIGALCLAVPPSAHVVVSSASAFLLNWLFEREHKHRQWSAALSLGLICSRLASADKKQAFGVTSALLEVMSQSEARLVKGACGLGLGYAAAEGLSSTADRATDAGREALGKILISLTSTLAALAPSTRDCLKSLTVSDPMDGFEVTVRESADEDSPDVDEDCWAIAGLVIGLGNCAIAMYSAGATEAIIELKNSLVSWIRDLSALVEADAVPLCIGACLALPQVVAFLMRAELCDDDPNDLLSRYTSLASEILNCQKSGALFQNLLMSVSVGAGSIISGILHDGSHYLKLSDVERHLDTMKRVHTRPHHPFVHLGGFLGAINAFGGDSLDLNQVHRLYPLNSPGNNEKESPYIRGPLLANRSGEALAMSVIQEMILVAKDAGDKRLQSSAAWALSLLRSRFFPNNIHDDNDPELRPDGARDSPAFSSASLVWNLSIWLRDIDVCQMQSAGRTVLLSTVLRCLGKAPKLPAFQWQPIVRLCLRHELQSSDKPAIQRHRRALTEECLNFVLNHADRNTGLQRFLDDLWDLPRFRALETHLQCALLGNLARFGKLFLASRLAKLYEDLLEFFGSRSSPYWRCPVEHQSSLRRAFWTGSRGCLATAGTQDMERCMECLLSLLPVDAADDMSEAVQCLSLARLDWLADVLRIDKQSSMQEAGKRLIITARLVQAGRLPIRELGKLRTRMFNAETSGIWWAVLVEAAAAVVHVAEAPVQREWLLHALDVSCVTKFPGTSLRFAALIAGGCCEYMPVLVVDPASVLSDLPVTLLSFLAVDGLDGVRSTVADKMWTLTCRLVDGRWQSGSGDSWASSLFLVRVAHAACSALKEYLPFDKQQRLATMVVP